MTNNIFRDFEENRDKTIELLDGITSAVSLFTVSSEIRFLHFNKAADEMFGYTKGGLIDLTAEDYTGLFHPDYVDSLYGEIIATMRDGKIFNYNCQVLCADGSYKWINLSAQLVQQSNGTLYYHGVLTPIEEPADIKLKGLHALIAAGEKNDRNQLTELIEKYGGTCDTFQRGLDALDSFLSSEDRFYNCILIGCRMTDVNGFELAKEIRHGSHPQATSVPLLLMTDDTDAETLQEIGDIGITAYLRKPINPAKITKWLRALKREK